jgi:hypothetical protein
MRIFPTGRILFCFFSSSYRAINIFQRALIYYSPACRNSCFQFLSEFGVSVCVEVPVDLVLFFFQRFDSLLNNTGQLFELWIFSYRYLIAPLKMSDEVTPTWICSDFFFEDKLNKRSFLFHQLLPGYLDNPSCLHLFLVSFEKLFPPFRILELIESVS